MSGTRDIVWIASYPKSGNTWVRFLLCNLLFGPQSSASTLAGLIPDVHELSVERHGELGSGLVKSHFMCSPVMPLAGRTAGCIYVLRHPADVLLSNFHYAFRAGGGEPSPAALDHYVHEFIEHRGDPRWVRSGMGSWEGHVRSWLGEGREYPVYRVRYEELQSDPHGMCARMSAWLGTGASPERIAEAVAQSTFQRMREIEEADIRERRVGIFYKPYLEASIRAGRRFMRGGVSALGTGELSVIQRERLVDAFAPLLRELGYPAN